MTSDLTERMKRRAHELGFEEVGVAPAGRFPRADAFLRWLDAGFHGAMEYLARNAERRIDPTSVLPGARAVVCLLTRYRTQEIPDALLNDPRRGIIARYAWGADYHERLGARTRALADWIAENAAPAETRVYVDTGPVLERDAAELAGLGWIGKNSLLLNRTHGSYVFLSVALTTAPLVPDAPATDHCGSCSRCLDACPTNAFPEPYVLDASKCISYLTIERKDAIPPELRPMIGNRIFGCDICQEVCPWNRKAPMSHEEAFRPREGFVAPELVPLMRLDEESFRRRFRNSPIRRAKRRGFLRNAAVALGNSGDLSAVPVLAEALSDPEPLVRIHAAWALGRIGGEDARAALTAARRTESDEETLAEIDAALETLSDPARTSPPAGGNV